MSLATIKAERAAWGDPVETFETDIPACVTGRPLWLFRYANGGAEFMAARSVRQCAWNVGGDPASACDSVLNPYAQRDVCAHHERVVSVLESSRIARMTREGKCAVCETTVMWDDAGNDWCECLMERGLL